MSKFDKNFTENGYLMKFNRKPNRIPYKNCVLQFRIELLNIKPSIWRRIQVPLEYNFWGLHTAIQDSMGWQDCHLHGFEIRKKHKSKSDIIGIPDFEGFGFGIEHFPGWEISLTEYIVNPGETFSYTYDYGDNWEHLVTFEGYLMKEKRVKYPRCIDGQRACPPEDCGGFHGYERLLTVLSNPDDEEYEEMIEWLGDHWKPECFDKDEIVFDAPEKRWEQAFLADPARM